MDKAVEILGDEEPKTAQLHLGYHGHVLTFPIANGKILNGTWRVVRSTLLTDSSQS